MSDEPIIEYGPIPGRKSKAICVTIGSVCYPVAYFRDEASYEKFVEVVRGRMMLWLEAQ